MIVKRMRDFSRRLRLRLFGALFFDSHRVFVAPLTITTLP
jgi:hypothetical protein